MDHLERQKRKAHPKDRNNFLSNIFFIFAIKLFRKGSKRDLEETDLYEVLHNYRSKQLGDKLEQEWEKQKRKKNLSIVRLILNCYGCYYLWLGLVQLLLNVTMVVIQPYALGKLIGYFAPGQTDLTKQDAYFYAAVVLGYNFLQCVYRHNYYLLLGSFGIKVRTAFCSFIYRKALKLSPAHLQDISIGKIVTLITKDVDTFDGFIDFGNDIWIGFIKTLVVAVTLYNRIGVAALSGIGFFLLAMPFQIYLGTRVTQMKLKMCKKTDERLQVTQESLSAIRIIKMYTWEKIFDTRISDARKKETHLLFLVSTLKSFILSIGSLSSHVSFYLMVMNYIWLGNVVTAEIIYFMMTTFHTLSYGLSVLFPIGIYQTAELKSAIKRIGYILKAIELEPERPNNDINVVVNPRIHFKDVTVTVKTNKILKEINVNFEKGLTVITGAVGSGKSFLLKTILQDFKPDEGNLLIEGNISYASQEPWLFPSSIKQNILFGLKYDEKRYNQVLKVCALIYDFELFEEGDQTIVEDRGINLSKGQQARINLARAVYKESDIYLLDDSLAALDANVSAFIFKECILEFLKDKIVILVSHNVKYGKQADSIIVMKNGCITSVGKFSEFKEWELLEATENETNTNNDDNEKDDPNEESKLLAEQTVQRLVYHEEKQTGEVSTKIYKKYIQFGGGFIAIFLVFSLFIANQVSSSYIDKLISNWVNLEEKISNQTIANSTQDDQLIQDRQFIFYMYTGNTIATVLTTFGRSIAILLFARAASIRLHKEMISTIINAAMYFFDMNFIGNILNRFSKDLIVVDEYLPFAISQVFRICLVVIGIFALIASVNVMFLIPAIIFLMILVVLRGYCLRTSRSLKRLDASTRSPVVGYLNASLEGLTTIRAFQSQTILRDEFDRHQDLYTSASYTLMSSMRAFAFTMDTMCGFFIMFIVLTFLIRDNDFLAGHVGLAISEAFALVGTLQWGIRQWAEIENRMTSVERVLEYTDIRKEVKQGVEPESWPSQGEIQYRNVFLTYTNSNENVLKNINFTIKAKEKIGVVGRTGAGKSSIISTLFRLYDVKGEITIDGVNIKTVALDYLRSKISIIPQDPVLFSGTVRENIDPIGKYTDDEIWKAIRNSHLDQIISSLDMRIAENATNFSIGQRQLICLARAIIQKNKIIVLDEATANMDPETDFLLQQTIKENFQHCTVITIAHKLDSILKSDRVLVMDKGEVVNFEDPDSLLKNTNGIFYKMVAKTGLLSKLN